MKSLCESAFKNVVAVHLALWGGGGSAAQFRRDEVLPSMGILGGGRYPSASIHFTNAATKKHVLLIFGNLIHINGVINSIHCAGSHGRTRQALCFKLRSCTHLARFVNRKQ
jgi:hypothetical protein